MIDRNSLLDQLKKLPDSEWDEVIFRLEVDESHLRIGVTKNQRSIDLISLLGQQDSGLQRLQKIIRDLSFFKELIPAGTYPVGDALRQREEAHEQEAMENALAHGEEEANGKITPEKFYSFQRGTEWLGVFREWDTPRSFRMELLETTLRNGRSRLNCPAASIIGHGGSGKSVALRRLALDLVAQGSKVWWVESPERLVEFGLDDFIDDGDRPQFLLIDEIQDLDSSYVDRLSRHLKKHPGLVLVVAGRSLPKGLRLGSKNQFTPNEADDRIAILDKISEVLPAWAATAAELKTETLREARLVRILLVLARRQAPIPKTLEELEESFLQILADDLERIRQDFPGLATAILDAAIFRETGMNFISASALVALATYHQPNARIPQLLMQFDNNPRWSKVAPLMFFDRSHKHFLFHHDEIGEGLIQASQVGLVDHYIDDIYRKDILDVVIHWAVVPPQDIEIDPGLAKTISYLLWFFTCKHPDLLDSATALSYIHELLNAEITHYAYLGLIVHDANQ
jgi:hypothetical protein